jgi:photosystem II PsbZ protein
MQRDSDKKSAILLGRRGASGIVSIASFSRVVAACLSIRSKFRYSVKQMLSILFQLVLAALVFWSFVMVVGVPVAYASPQNWDQSKPLLYLGSGLWIVLVLVVAVLNFLVV